jgi:hypothetical protein
MVIVERKLRALRARSAPSRTSGATVRVCGREREG